MRRFLLFFTVGVITLSVLFIIVPFGYAQRQSDSIAGKIVRLHVIANSDSEADQLLKLAVRDSILGMTADLTEECNNSTEARAVIGENLSLLEDSAKKVISESGYSYVVSAELSDEYYPTKEYEGMRLPAGVYSSLRIKIGSAQGHNWWCVIFPPVCKSSAKADEELAEAGFTPNQVRLLTDDEDTHYVIRFRLIEAVSEIKERIRSFFR